MIKIYTDGSCLGNPGGFGGWAAIVLNDNTIIRTVCGTELKTTNNRMELLAIIKGIESAPLTDKIGIYTDSQYIVNTATKGWKRTKNKDLWDRLAQLHDIVAEIEYNWVRGHNGDHFNEMANLLATFVSGHLKEACR